MNDMQGERQCKGIILPGTLQLEQVASHPWGFRVKGSTQNAGSDFCIELDRDCKDHGRARQSRGEPIRAGRN